MIRDDAIVAALAAGMSNVAAARRGNTTEKTVRNRLKIPEFRARVEEATKRAQGLQRVYTALEMTKEAWGLVFELYDDEEMFDTTVGEAIRHLKASIEWLDEWAYLLEEECAS